MLKIAPRTIFLLYGPGREERKKQNKEGQTKLSLMRQAYAVKAALQPNLMSKQSITVQIAANRIIKSCISFNAIFCNPKQKRKANQM